VEGKEMMGYNDKLTKLIPRAEKIAKEKTRRMKYKEDRINWEWNRAFHFAMDQLAAEEGIRPARIRKPDYKPCHWNQRETTDPRKL